MKKLCKRIKRRQYLAVFFLLSILIFLLLLFIAYQEGKSKTYQKLFAKYQSVLKEQPPIIPRWNAYSNEEIPIKLRIPPEFSINVDKGKEDNKFFKIQFISPNIGTAISSVIIESGVQNSYETYLTPHCILVETKKIDTALAEIHACITNTLKDPSFITKLSDNNHDVFVAFYTKKDFTEKDIFEYRYLLNSIRLY